METQPQKQSLYQKRAQTSGAAVAISTTAPPMVGVERTHKLRSSFKKPADISAEDRAHMYLLMREYYAELTEPQFLADLLEKSDVIILRDSFERVCGFSTLLKVEIPALKGKVRAIYSGDTVVDRAYWGQKQLGVAFLQYLFLEKLKRPFSPLYWMLMSKGYKTYLLMANNFSVHYPRVEEPTPQSIQHLIDSFYTSRFGAKYDKGKGIVKPEGASCRLREGVAPVTEELKAKFPRVAFFEKANPQWSEGVELACIAEMKLAMPLMYTFKKTLSARIRNRTSR